jgi:hypothetical protein
MSFDLKKLIATRRSICEQCPHFKGKNTCGYLQEKTGKAGRLDHPLGIVNPRARCPDRENRRWNFIPSYHAWYIDEMTSVSEETIRNLTRRGVAYIKPIDMVNYLYSLGFTNMSRSVLLKEVQAIATYENDYKYIDKLGYAVDYVTGRIYYE